MVKTKNFVILVAVEISTQSITMVAAAIILLTLVIRGGATASVTIKLSHGWTPP